MLSVQVLELWFFFLHFFFFCGKKEARHISWIMYIPLYLQPHSCKCFTQPHNSFQLPHSNWYNSCLPCFICLPSHILQEIDIDKSKYYIKLLLGFQIYGLASFFFRGRLIHLASMDYKNKFS